MYAPTSAPNLWNLCLPMYTHLNLSNIFPYIGLKTCESCAPTPAPNMCPYTKPNLSNLCQYTLP